jgi:uncharacterized membrane protein YhaH (DUF805 family)
MFRPITVLMSVLKRLTSFRGRAGRGDFWAVFLLTTAVTVILLLHPASVVSTGAIQVKRLLLAIFFIQVASPFILAAYTSRRLHDLDKPSWWTIPFLVALISLATIWTQTGQSILSSLAGAEALESVAFVLSAVSASVVATFLYLLSLKGTAEPNEHGPAPGDFDLRYLLAI